MVKTSRPKTKARFERDRERCKLAIDALFRQVSQGKVPRSLPQTKEKKSKHSRSNNNNFGDDSSKRKSLKKSHVYRTRGLR